MCVTKTSDPGPPAAHAGGAAALPRAEAVLRVLHADDHLLVLDKFSGLLTVPAKPPGSQDCLEARARAVFPDALLVHRLDRDTSGVIVLARSRLAQRHLGWQFERRQVAKGYVARVAGSIVAASGRIDLPLICDWPNRPRQMVCHARGRKAVTEWRVLGFEPGVTRLRLHPLTGRSHQIRVHLAALGHPILGDPFYAPPAIVAAAPRLQLHAETLRFRHPLGGAWVTFRSDPPF
jgi:tRNA pseudouridine32 synthase / 23S rRNA pseudouridine746 synthase